MCCKYNKLEESYNHTEYNRIDKTRQGRGKKKKKKKTQKQPKPNDTLFTENQDIVLAEFSSDIMHGEKIMH